MLNLSPFGDRFIAEVGIEMRRFFHLSGSDAKNIILSVCPRFRDYLQFLESFCTRAGKSVDG